VNTLSTKSELISKTKVELESFVNDRCAELCTAEAMDLLKQMLIYDHTMRITAREALNHPFFDSVKSKF
jgi:casein kinase II subunit alpha